MINVISIISMFFMHKSQCHLLMYAVKFVVDGTDSFVVAFDQAQAAGNGQECNYNFFQCAMCIGNNQSLL